MIPKPLTLEKTVSILIHQLAEKGLLKDVHDIEDLVEKTMANLKESMGENNLPVGNDLKNPQMLMKLTLAIVATHTLEPEKAKLISKGLFNNLDKTEKMEFDKAFEELGTKLKNNPELRKFMELVSTQMKSNQANPDAPKSPDDQAGALYADDGTFLIKLPNYFKASPGERVVNASEVESMGMITFFDEVNIELSKEMSPRPGIY